MQIRSRLWKELAASGNARMETSVAIGGHTYAPESAIEISRAIGPSALSVGNCVTATVLFSIRPIAGAEIFAGAAAVVKCRFTDGQRESEWLTMGTFYVSRRTDYPTNGLLEFEGYDAMRKADAPYPSLSGFPKAMNSAVSEIARNMGVEVDGRTWDSFPTGAEYYVPLPAENEKMISVLGYIGGVCGGNWVITPQGRLRFVPLASASGAASASDKADVVGILGGITVGESATVTGAVTVSERKEMIEGDDSGAVIRAPSNPYFTRALLESLLTRYKGISYVPFEIQRAIYDPAMEVGDYIVRRVSVSGVSREYIASVIWQESARYGPAFRGDLSAPFLSVAGTQSLSETIDIAGDNYSDLSLRFYKFVNDESVVIGNGLSEDIINLDFGAGAKQDVIFHAEIKHTVATVETGNATDGWTCTDAVLTVTYYINDAKVTEYYPVQTETDGVRLLHLQYQWANGRYTIGNFRAALSVRGGAVTIAAGDVRAYIMGQGYTGAYFDTDAAHDLLGILITSFPTPDGYYYTLDKPLNYEGLVVKAQYRNMDEKTVTDECVFEPGKGRTPRQEGLNDAGAHVVTVTYAENGKAFTTDFDIWLLDENGGLIAVKITVFPYVRTYETGEKLNLSGLKVTAFYGDGTTRDVTNEEDCVISVKHADSETWDYVFSLFNPSYDVPLNDGKTLLSVTYQGKHAGDFYVFCGAGDFAWIASPPDKLTYYLGDTLDLTGVVVMASENGVEAEVTESEDCAFDPEDGTELEFGDTIVTVTYKGVRLDDSFTVNCAAGNAEHGYAIALRVAEPPTKQRGYLIDREGENLLILDGVVIMALYGDMEEENVTEDCAFNPGDGDPLEEGFTTVIVTYANLPSVSFEVHCGKADGDWITENGLMLIAAESYKSDYATGDTLDLTDAVVKAYYGNGTDKTVTDKCVFFPAHGALLDEGETVVTVSYAEGGKECQDKFSVYCAKDGYDIMYIEVIEPPRKTRYYQGDALNLSGLVIGAVQENGHVIVNIKPDCRFSPAEGDTLSTSGVVTVTATRQLSEALGGGTFTTYFDVDVEAVKARGDGWTLLENGTLIIDGDVDWEELLEEIAPYVDDIISIVIGDDTPIMPEILAELIAMSPNLQEIILPPDVDLEEIQELIDSLTVIQIVSYPAISDYAVNETLDYTGLQVTKKLPHGEPEDITADCVVSPAEGTEITEPGDIMVDVRYNGKSVGTFWVATNGYGEIIASGSWWTLDSNGGLHIFYGGYMPDYSPSSPPPWNEYKSYIKSVTVASYTHSVGAYAFDGCHNLSNVTFATTTGAYVYEYDSSGDWDEHGNPEHGTATETRKYGVESIGEYAFYNCDSLESVTIPACLGTINQYAFANCFSLSNVTISTIAGTIVYESSLGHREQVLVDGLGYIRIGAFDECARLADIYYDNTEEEWEGIRIESKNDMLLSATIHYNSSGSS